MEIFDFGFLYKLSKKRKNKRTMQEKMQKGRENETIL